MVPVFSRIILEILNKVSLFETSVFIPIKVSK